MNGTQSVHVFAARHLSSENFRTEIHVVLITGLNEVVAKVIFLHLSVILFTGGVSASVTTPPHPRSKHPGSRHPLEADTSPVSRLRHTVNERPVCILLECILVPVLFGQNLFKFRKFGFIQPSISVFSISTMFLFYLIVHWLHLVKSKPKSDMFLVLQTYR